MVFSPFVYGIFSMFSLANEWICDFLQRWNKNQLKLLLPDLILQVSQNTPLSKAHRTSVFANTIDKIIMTLGNHSPEFNSRLHQSQFIGWKKHVPQFRFHSEIKIVFASWRSNIHKEHTSSTFLVSVATDNILYCIEAKYTVSAIAKTLCTLAFPS